MRRFGRDWISVGLLLLLPLLLFASVSLGSRTLLPADALYLFEPYRTAAEGSAVDVTQVQNPLLADLVLQNYAWKQFLLEALESRTLPLWDPYLFSGHPFLANGQHSALYPLTWLFFILPLPRAFGVFTVVQLGLAGVWMYIFGRTLHMGRLGALVAGITFQLSGFMVVSVVHPMIIAAASWLPLLLAMVECTVTRRSLWLNPASSSPRRTMLPWALLGAIVLGLQTLAGHPEITYFVLLVTAGYAGWRILYRLLTLPRATWRAEVLSPALGIGVLLCLGLALGAVQLIPFYEVARESFRQDRATLQEVLGWAYPTRRLITFLIPNFFGNPTHRTLFDLFARETVTATRNAHGGAINAFDWGIKNYVEGGAYLGILPLLLSLIAVFGPRHLQASGNHSRSGGVGSKIRGWIRRPYVPFFTALALFSAACVFGTPIYALVYALPFLSQSHSPFRWVLPLTLAGSALAGIGAAALARRQEPLGTQQGSHDSESVTPHQPWLLRWLMLQASDRTTTGLFSDPVSVLAAGAVWGSVLTVAGVLTSRLAFGQIEPLVERAFWSLARASYAFPDARAFYSYLAPWILVFAGFLFASGIVLRMSRGSRSISVFSRRIVVWQALALVLIAVDLTAFGAGFNPAVDPALLDYRPPAVDFLSHDTELWRLSTFDPEGLNTLNPNVSMLYGLQDVRGYDSLFSAQYARYMGWIEPQTMLPYNRIAPFREFSSLDSPLTDLLNVKYVLTEVEIPLPKYHEVYRDDAVRIYENLGVTPRAFTLPLSATLVVSDVAEVEAALLTYDPRYYVVVEAAGAGWSGPRSILVPPEAPVPGLPDAQSIVAYSNNELLIEARVDEPGWLVVADSFAPGWKAFVRPLGGTDREETEVAIARIAGNFRGIRLDESQEVRLRYSPDSVKVGAFLSFLSGMVIIFLSTIWSWRLIYREQEDAAAVQRLAKNSIAPILLTLFNRAVDFAFAALMLRILGPTNAGDYYYAINVFLWFDILTNFGLNTYLTREVARNRQQARRYLVNTTMIRFALSLFAVPLLLSFIGIRQTLIADVTAPASRQAVIAILLLYLGSLPYSISNGLTALFYAYEKAEYPAAITTVSTLIKVTIQTLALIVGWGIVGLAGMSIVVNVVTLAILGVTAWRLFPALRRAGSEERARGLLRPRREDRALRREMIRESWPLMANHLLAYLFYKVDVFLMEPLLGSASLGLYSVGYKFLDAVMIVPSMFTLALFPVISRHAEDNRDALIRFYRLGTKILVLLALAAALFATFAGREMVLILGGVEFLPGAAEALRLMAWSMPIGWINGITQYVLISVNQQRYLTRAYLIGFGFSLLANLFLMPRFGYAASATLHIFSELVLFVPFVIGVRRYIGVVGWSDVLGKPLLVAAVSGAIALLLLPVNRMLAVAVTVVTYPLLAWLVGVITPDERAMLAPLFHRRGRQAAEAVQA